MTIYSVYSKNAKESGFDYTSVHYALTSAKREMKRLMKAGFVDVSGNKTRIYANGDSVNCGDISLSGSNKSFVANSRQTKAGY